MGRAFRDISKFACYGALVIAALLFLIVTLFGAGGGRIWSILTLAKDVFVLLGIGFGAYSFAAEKRNMTWMIIFWVALVVYIIAIALAAGGWHL